MPELGKNEQFFPVPIIEWPRYRTIPEWQIHLPDTLSQTEVRSLISTYMVTHRRTDAFVNEPTPEPGDFIDIKARFINEGKKNGIALFEAEDGKRAIVVMAKDLGLGADQTRDDYRNLQKLRANLPPGSDLTVPLLYGDIMEATLNYDRRTLPAYVAEFLPYEELSCTAMKDPPGFLFVTNIVDTDLTMELSRVSRISTEQLQENLVKSLAKNQTMVYLSMDRRMQREFSINAGDYTIRQRDGKLEFALITLNGGMTEELPMEEFLYRLFTHSEPGLHTQLSRLQEQHVQPFGMKADQTIRGVEEALSIFYPNTGQETLRDALEQSLIQVQNRLQHDAENQTINGVVIAAIEGYTRR